MKYIKVTLIKSFNKRLKKHQACVRGLGLRKIGQSRLVVDSPENRGMIGAVQYMLRIEQNVAGNEGGNN